MSKEELTEELREGIARDFLFDIWKEAKSSMGDSWDNVQWESLPEKHKEEYLKTANRLLKLLDDNKMVFLVEKELPEILFSEKPEIQSAFVEGMFWLKKEANWHPIERIKLEVKHEKDK